MTIELIEPEQAQDASFKLDLDKRTFAHIQGWMDDVDGDLFFTLRQYRGECWTKLSADQCRSLAQMLQQAADALEARHA